MSNCRKPYSTRTRDLARLYLRECIQADRSPNICEAVRRGVGANRASARRAIRFVMEREFDPYTAA